MERRPSMGLLKIEELFKVLHGHEPFYRSSIGRISSIVLLYIRGLIWDLTEYETCYRASSMGLL